MKWNRWITRQRLYLEHVYIRVFGVTVHLQFLSPPLIKERRILDGVETANYYHGLGKRSIFAKKKRTTTTTTTTTTTEPPYYLWWWFITQENKEMIQIDPGLHSSWQTLTGPLASTTLSLTTMTQCTTSLFTWKLSGDFRSQTTFLPTKTCPSLDLRCLILLSCKLSTKMFHVEMILITLQG